MNSSSIIFAFVCTVSCFQITALPLDRNSLEYFRLLKKELSASNENEKLTLSDKEDQDIDDSALDISDKLQLQLNHLQSDILLAHNKAVKVEKSVELLGASQVIIYKGLNFFLYGFAILSLICFVEILERKWQRKKHRLELTLLKKQMKLLKPEPLAASGSEGDRLPDYNAL